MNPRREELKALSAPFKGLVKQGAIDSVNTGLVGMYAAQGHKILKTFNQWKKEGYSIKKGEKALLLWGTPRPITVQPPHEPQAPTTDNQEEDSESDFFPVAYIFSNLQVTENERTSA